MGAVEVRRQVGCFKTDSRIVGGDRVVQPPQRQQNVSAVEVRTRMLGRDPHGVFERRKSFRTQPHPLQDDAEIVVRVRALRTEAEHAPVCLCRLRQSPQVAKDVTSIMMRRGEVGVDAQRLIVGGDGLFRVTGVLEHDAEVAVIVRSLWLKPDRAPDQCRSRAAIPFIMGNKPQELQRLGIVGALFEHRFAQPAAQVEPASAVMHAGDIEALLLVNLRASRLDGTAPDAHRQIPIMVDRGGSGFRAADRRGQPSQRTSGPGSAPGPEFLFFASGCAPSR